MEVGIDLDDSDDHLGLTDSLVESTEASSLSGRPMENLKICIDNEGGPDPSVTFVKMETVGADDAARGDDSSSPTITLKLSSGHKKSTYKENKKVYENELGGFEAGMDISSEEVKSKRMERAKRFGIDDVQQVNEKRMDIEALYKSLGVTELDLKEVGERRIRRDTIMLRGVNDLNTNDVFSYFSEYPPTSLEWLDDSSCNVLFGSINDANRALINMSHPIRTVLSTTKRTRNIKSSFDTSKGTHDDEIEVTSNVMDDTIDLMTDVVDSEVNPYGNFSTISAPQNTLEMVMEEGEIASDEDVDSEPGVYMDEDETPPGKWRVSVPSDKYKSKLFMRFATKADVKIKGAEKNSDYYKRHGNPNYGGMQGLISRSKKEKYRRTQELLLEKEARQAVADLGARPTVTYNADDLFGETYEEPDADNTKKNVGSQLKGGDKEPSSVYNTSKRGHDRIGTETVDINDELKELMEESGIAKKKRIPMMRMVADEEEEKLNLQRTKASAILVETDVRNQLKNRKQDRHSHSDFAYDDVVKTEAGSFTESPSPPSELDLRSRLSRRNDW